LVVRVDTNTERKDYAATWKALVPVMKRHTDIQVHFHCTKSGPMAVNLAAVLDKDEETKNRFSFPNLMKAYLGWEEQDLVGLYNAADLFVSTSRGEGFGLTLAEAAACGVPIVAQNVSAIPEVVGPGAQLVDPLTTITTLYGQDVWLPDVDGFTEAIEHLYLSGGVRRKLGQAGRKHVASFSWDDAADDFDHYITEATSAAAA
jgi:glycosyltransferase involved in cell wall biosynthesis